MQNNNLDSGISYNLDLLLQSDAGKMDAVALIIESAAFAYSVFRKWNLRLHYPVAVIVENLEMADEIAEKFGIFNKRIISLNMPPIRFYESLKEYHDDVCILQYYKGRYTADNIETLITLSESGGDEAINMEMLPLLIFEKIIPEEYQNSISIVLEMNTKIMNSINWEFMETSKLLLKNYILTRIQVLEYELCRHIAGDSNNRDYRFWFSVIEVIGVVFSDELQTANELKEHLYNSLQKAYDLSNFYEYEQQIPELFRKSFDTSIPEISTFLPEANSDEFLASDIKDTVLYSSEHYYIPEALFVRICESLKCVGTVNQIKDVLAREGILCTQGKGRIYRTIKKNIGKSNTPVRFVWLNRAKLEGEMMEMSYVDMYQIRRNRNA